MIYFWIDTIMLTLMTRSEVVGWYGATTQLFQTLMFLPVLVQTAWLPRLVTAFVKGRRDLVETARAPVELVLVISVPIAAGVRNRRGSADPRGVRAGIRARGPGHDHPRVLHSADLSEHHPGVGPARREAAGRLDDRHGRRRGGESAVQPRADPLTEHRYHNGAIGAAISLVLTELLMDIVGFVLVGRHVFDGRMLKRCALVAARVGGDGRRGARRAAARNGGVGRSRRRNACRSSPRPSAS